MQEIQRFNRVLKLFVLLGDIILLNLLLWGFEVVLVPDFIQEILLHFYRGWYY